MQLDKGKGKILQSDDENDADENAEVEPPTEHSSFPALVSHVCQYWRRVALETPVLWTHIGVDEASHIEEIAEWVSRAKACPLDIDIDIDDAGSDDDYDAENTMLARACALQIKEFGGELDEEQKECFNPLNILFDSLRLFIPHMKRWQKFCLQTTSFPAMLAAVFQIAIHDREHASAPILEGLILGCTDEFVDIKIYNSLIKHYGEQSLRLFGGHVPCLRDVSLWGVPIAYDILMPSPPTALNDDSPPITQLRELELAYMPWTELRPTYTQLAAILRGAPNLERLKFLDAGCVKESPEEVVEPIRLPSLRHLQLSDPAQVEEALDLIRFLHAPALDSLFIGFDEEDYTEAIRLLVSQPMVAGSDAKNVILPGMVPEGGEILLASLRELKLGGLMCSEDAIAALYRASHRVKKLFLNMNNLTPESATKLCLPWDTAIQLDTETSPHEAYQASTGVHYGPNNTGQAGQAVAEASAATTTTPVAVATNAPQASSSAATSGFSGDRNNSLAAKESIPLPELTELTVSGMSGLDMIAIVMMRKEMRVPLKALRIDRRDQEEEDISDEIWASLKKAVGKVEWVKVDTEDSDDDGDSDDDVMMSIDGLEDEDDFFVDEDPMDDMTDEEMQAALFAGMQEFGPGDEDAWEDVDDVD